MLRELLIRDFATIAEVAVEFGPGFNVLTGETGAGKSILIGAIGMLLGGRTSRTEIRTGARRAFASASFQLPPDWEGLPLLDALGCELEDGELLLQRELQQDGRNRCLVNGRPVPVSQLRRLSRYLIDILGQHEHQSLTDTRRHVRWLDGWAGTAALAGTLHRLHGRVESLRRERDELRVAQRRRGQELELYRYQAEELDGARLDPEAPERLEQEIRKLQHAQELREAAWRAYQRLYESEHSAAATAAEAARELRGLLHLAPDLEPILELIEDALPKLEEAGTAASAFADGVELDPERLQAAEERLGFLRSLERKYGKRIEELCEYRRWIGERLADEGSLAERLARLDEELAEASARLRQVAEELSRGRREGAARLAGALEPVFADLGLGQARFEVRFSPVEGGEQGIGPHGAEQVEFYFSANPGEDLRPLSRVASGGELSRIMLALRSIMAREDSVPTLIFDEVDSGIGGRTAELVAGRLTGLARERQVLCITHLPVIAARADRHIRLEKTVAGGRTETRAAVLSDGERVAELARMLGGGPEDAETLRFARALLGGAGA
jgi:DNA repair protein RecN (Recombination protein N)